MAHQGVVHNAVHPSHVTDPAIPRYGQSDSRILLPGVGRLGPSGFVAFWLFHNETFRLANFPTFKLSDFPTPSRRFNQHHLRVGRRLTDRIFVRRNPPAIPGAARAVGLPA